MIILIYNIKLLCLVVSPLLVVLSCYPVSLIINRMMLFDFQEPSWSDVSSVKSPVSCVGLCCTPVYE